jgi:hypothetical protein
VDCRQIIIQDETGCTHESFWCDAAHCDSCSLRYKCFTSAGNMVITFTLEELDEKLNELHSLKWRLRDGSSEFRERRSKRVSTVSA